MISIRPVDALALSLCLWIIYGIVKTARSRARTTKLNGPPTKSWLFGVTKEVFDGDNGAIYEAWAQAYGSVFQIMGPLGGRRVVLTDPKAIAHYYAKPDIYVKDDFNKAQTEDLIGKGILWADGDMHRRQRKALNPPFTSGSIRETVHIFYESGYKAKAAWDDILSKAPKGEAIINVQKWMNCVSLDSIGIAGFGHDFGALHGARSVVEQVFDSLSSVPTVGMAEVLFLLGPLNPSVYLKIPTGRQKMLQKLNRAMLEIAESLLERTKKDAEEGSLGASSRSIIGALIRAENSNAKSALAKDEILSQMQTLMLAGYETTSISLTWALIELALHPEKQDKLRNELLAVGADPTYDQLMNELPYLDSVLREILRLHPPVETVDRKAACEDMMPLIEPVKTAAGQTVSEVRIGAGTLVVVPIRAINRSGKIWGPDAKVFKPERWLDQESGLTPRSKEYTGYHHILSFTGGPRICLGRLFAVTEFKVVLGVLVRNFVFDMRDGPETRVETQTTLLPRPKIIGEEGYAMPMRIRRFNA